MLEDFSQHILDIAENGVNAGADEILIVLRDSNERGVLELEISDNGKGMDEETLLKAVDPFSTSRTTRKVGLGLPFLKQAAELNGGEFSIQSEPGVGTKVIASFLKNSIDLPPEGDIPSSLVSLVVAHPDIRWIYSYLIEDAEFHFDSREITEILEDPSLLTRPDVAEWMYGYIADNIKELKSGGEVVN